MGQGVDGKVYIYWLLKSSCFKLPDDEKYGLFLSQEVDGKDYFYWLPKLFWWWEILPFFSRKMDGKIIFTGYGEVIILNFSVMGNAIFFLSKKLMERWYLLGLGLFELSMNFQDDLGNTAFLAETTNINGLNSLLSMKSLF